MQTVRWTDEAITDLVEIIDYIEQRNPLAAEALHAAILRTVEGLPSAPYVPLGSRARFPRMYRASQLPGDLSGRDRQHRRAACLARPPGIPLATAIRSQR